MTTLHGPPPGRNVGRGLATTALDTVQPRPVKWLVPDLIPLGKLSLIAGEGGDGKTTLTLDLTASLTTGRPAFGLSYDPPPPADVLLIACEDDAADTLVPHLLACGADLSRVKHVKGVPSGPGKDGQPRTVGFSLADFEQLERTLEESPQTRLVVIDPAGAYLGGTRVDDHKDSELRSLLGPLAEVAARRDVSIILVKHLSKRGKGGSVRARDLISGSVAYVNAVRAVFMVVPDPDHHDRKLLLPEKGNHTKPGTCGLAFRLKPLDHRDRERVTASLGHLSPADRESLLGQLFHPVWEGPVGIDADTAISAPPRRPTRVEQCADWLRQFLGKRAWPAREVETAAVDAGYTLDNLKAARTQLGKADPPLKSKPSSSGGMWWWWIGHQRPQERPTHRGTPETPEFPETPRSGDQEAASPHSPETPETPQAEKSHGGEKIPVGQGGRVLSWESRECGGLGSHQGCHDAGHFFPSEGFFEPVPPHQPAGESADDRYTFEERCAIREYCGGLSRAEAGRISREETGRGRSPEGGDA